MASPRPSPYVGFLGNYNGDEPTSAPAPEARSDPFLTAAERCVLGVPDLFVPSRPPYASARSPKLVGYPGYRNEWSAERAYYLADGVWRDTETGALYQPA